MRGSTLLLLVLAVPGLAWAEEPLTLLGLDDAAVAVLPAEGQVLLLHFWATWCPTCVDDLAQLQSAAAECGEDRLRVYAVNVGEEELAVRAFVAEHSVRLPVLRDPEARVWRSTGARGLPANLFWSVGSRRTKVGPRSGEEWRRDLSCAGDSGVRRRLEGEP